MPSSRSPRATTLTRPAMEEYKKKTNTGDDVFIRVHVPHVPSPSGLPGTHASLQARPPALAPTAVLFGWLGASHRNLAKYSALYERMGYNSVQLIAPPSTVFALSPRSPRVFLLSVLRILAADERLCKGGLVFMMFSNGGAVCAPHLAQMLAGEGTESIKADDELVVKVVKDSIAAVVFDSSPCYLHSHLGALAINEGLGVPEGPLRLFVIVAFYALCFLQKIFVCNLPVVFWTALRNADYQCPELYLYSVADHLLDAPRLDALIEERKQSGRQVCVFRVHDADHVSILRKHPDKYVETLRSVNDWGVNAYRRRAGYKPWVPPPTPPPPPPPSRDD